MASPEANSLASEQALWDDFRDLGRSGARAEIVRHYEPFARAIAARVYSVRLDSSVAFADYLQYARMGLIEAVDRYDPHREVAFRTFAVARIRGAILNGLAKESESAAQNRFWRTHVRDRVESLKTALAPAADRASLAQIAMITVGLAMGVLLDDTRDALEPSDQNPTNNPYAANETLQLREAIKRLVAQLPDKERIVIVGHYVELVEFQVLAERMGLSKGRIAQIHAQALLRLRQWLEQRPQIDGKF